ncbi:electron transport complex protein RnfC [Pseudomonas pohangensis]|uniref:Ion-translocating oxidoreductase complex subunit C n=1 Tax=Pseudomonas pohangensis TaxID=364197 RepID=A0A1H2EEB6_9PSED|nr:electron transport complex subunit RsxC [Pseudomonas pohangensis]SDT93477.1 electron transport complex protein RnfC [Pseudomonas pohangensis]
MSAREFFDIPGGIHPDERKTLSNRTAIQSAPLPKRLILPLNQHIGTPAEPCVSVGQRVLKGQLIAEATSAVSVPVHAPTSGTVSFIGAQPYPHVSGMLAPAVVIDSDGLDEWAPLQPCDHFHQLAATELLEKIRAAGVNGLGGAGFPTAVKLSARPQQKIHTLIINGTECEPYITADDLLMREKAAELLSGINILAHLIQPEEVLIGIEDNKPEAAAAILRLIGERPYEVVVFPTKYPSGGEKQLIQILTGREVPSGGLPADVGVLCQNVGTTVAIHDAVILGRPLISRITTLTGEALARPMNVECLLGTPVSELLAFAGLQQDKLNRLIMGGPMMGFTLPALDVPVIKTTNCLLASTAAELPAPPPAQPCIRCGDCAQVCPASLLPQQLHFFALGEQTDQLKAHQLFDCIECGACAYVCPSSIPLVQYYRAAKAGIREQEQLQQKADYSKQRFEFRQERLRLAEEQKEAERQARAERNAKARASQTDSSPVAPADEQLKRLKIEASMAQVALKKAEKQLAQHDTDELKAQIAQLRRAAEAAQLALQQAQANAPEPAAVPSSSADDQLKKARIEAAMLKAQVRKLEKVESPNAEQQAQLEQMRSQLSSAEQALGNSPTPAPTPAATPAKPVVDAALKKAKIELAVKRAELKKAEKAELAEAELQSLRAAVSVAETALHAAEAASPKPAPEHVLVNKSGLDEQQRALKTEVAFARADLRKLERDGSAAAQALDSARTRLAEAERQLAAYQEQSAC